MTSRIFTFVGNESIISTDFAYPIELDSKNNAEYGLALIGFHSYNSIPNIEEGENKFIYYENVKNSGSTSSTHQTIIPKKKTVTIPTGSYEIEDIENYLRTQIIPQNVKNELYDEYLSIKPNNNTLQCEIYSDKYTIDFSSKNGTIANLLGFSNKILPPKIKHKSDLPVNIIKVRSIQIECNIVTNSYFKNKMAHTLYSFAIDVDPGYAINEIPKHLIYLDINVKDKITNISFRIVDQNFKPINFRGEDIVIHVELKKLS